MSKKNVEVRMRLNFMRLFAVFLVIVGLIGDYISTDDVLVPALHVVGIIVSADKVASNFRKKPEDKDLNP